ncbi:MAG: outer membrane protein transport protein [Saprospiraceae bacterium]|nr:outer membrane protein transport protein [Saprospiraceae bacterium]
MRYLIFSITLGYLITPLLLNGQTLQDAVRYSQLEAGGTARTVGIGGGIGALGADFSVLSTNPAGLATFRRSEFTFTPLLNRNENESQLEDQAEPNVTNKVNFGFSNLGLVFPSRPLSANWTNTAFGIGFNRLATYTQRAYYEGITPGSITERWANLAQGIPADADFYNDYGEIEGGLAVAAGAIYNTDPNDNTTYTTDFLPGELLERSQNIRRRGSLNEMVISYAGNFKDRFMIGATMGLPLVNFEENKTYVETVVDPTNPVFNELTYKEKLNTTAIGINFKLGMIYRVNQTFRVGVAIHTPTGFGMKDSFSSSLDYSYNIGGIPTPGSAVSPDGNFEYRIRTPWRAIGSVGFVFEKKGFIVAEVEYVDYLNANFNFNETSNQGDIEYEGELNQQIADQLKSGLNIRLGGEYAMDRFRFRGGYTIAQSPYEGGEAAGVLSLGAGAWLSESVFLDAAYRQQTTGEQQYAPYLLNGQPTQNVNQFDTRSQILMTLGFKF